MALAQPTDALLLVTADGETVSDSDALQGTWTTEQYLRLTDQSNRLIEFTSGVLEVLPMPTKRHQTISLFMLRLLLAFLEPVGGAVFYAPLRLRIGEGKFREPDLIAAVDANDPRLQDAYFLGADLVMEVVSPDNPERDTVIKRAEYAEAHIPEYWIVNPLDGTITVLRLQGEEYAEHGLFRRGDVASSALLAGFSVQVSELFDVR
ncbi:MAG: Uma2 family endonuclease [Chloroflexota bacterium]|nr:Uma2 family endonuclease [Chloroflexota bacterium]